MHVGVADRNWQAKFIQQYDDITRAPARCRLSWSARRRVGTGRLNREERIKSTFSFIITIAFKQEQFHYYTSPLGSLRISRRLARYDYRRDRSFPDFLRRLDIMNIKSYDKSKRDVDQKNLHLVLRYFFRRIMKNHMYRWVSVLSSNVASIRTCSFGSRGRPTSVKSLPPTSNTWYKKNRKNIQRYMWLRLLSKHCQKTEHGREIY